MESTLSASSTLGAIGSLAKPARKTRRSQNTGTLTGSQGISSAGQSISSRTTPGAQSTSRAYAREAIVEAMSDAALVELVLADDQDAFTVLVERYKDAVQNLAYRMLSNAAEAEDVTQETFVRAYTQLATYKPAHKFSTWLLSIASHLAIDQLRRRPSWHYHLKMHRFLTWLPIWGTALDHPYLEA